MIVNLFSVPHIHITCGVNLALRLGASGEEIKYFFGTPHNLDQGLIATN